MGPLSHIDFTRDMTHSFYKLREIMQMDEAKENAPAFDAPKDLEDGLDMIQALGGGFGCDCNICEAYDEVIARVLPILQEVNALLNGVEKGYDAAARDFLDVYVVSVDAVNELNHEFGKVFPELAKDLSGE